MSSLLPAAPIGAAVTLVFFAALFGAGRPWTVELRLNLPATRCTAALIAAGAVALIAHDGLQGPTEVRTVAWLAAIAMCCEAAVKIAQTRAQGGGMS
ncbi:hypothetical protein [Streptomyces sp. HNM0574]|uniref:hypothetical protein n=1 Tax=Streptomyces sp. HNM0574 TaxID=2714954 RepID=UPI00146A4AB6|nr:hypothetical protein [Streptomyces sp. HNM0574]NLU67897.1 hypothetical protein [Streptomyces sp. HNM0574]